MENQLVIYNTLSRTKEPFVSLIPGRVGMYVCGPTVYGDPHLGHARPAITFDVVFRYLQHLGYKVRYVRNITDVGHLENDADEGEDKIAKKARLEQLEPMEIVQFYSDRYRKCMDELNVMPPSIEPRASGHIIEQLEIVDDIVSKGMGYVSNGSVYFDVERYNKNHKYGILSGRVVDELLATTRELDGQEEKRFSADFAIWKKAAPEHIMRWNSKYSVGFPGWHLECTAMSTKYLGDQFDIHGGGMDLQFPHHECEIAQAMVYNGKTPAKYWMHNNMITINGQKMGKSLGNFINLDQFFSGTHPLLERAYAPMTIRFFILQAHYRSTVDFSNEALSAAEKGLSRLLEAYTNLGKIVPGKTSTYDVKALKDRCYAALNDDLNTPIVLAHLFDGVKGINSILAGEGSLTEADIVELKNTMQLFAFDILGLKASESDNSSNQAVTSGVIDLLLEIRQEAKASKNWALSDKIRNQLTELGVVVKDTKDGYEWKIS